MKQEDAAAAFVVNDVFDAGIVSKSYKSADELFALLR